MGKKRQIELTWIGKENRLKPPPQTLVEYPAVSYHVETRASGDSLRDNKLIFGDNLLTLKALEQEHAGKVKCVYIDPPYNTGNAFEHYDESKEIRANRKFLRPAAQFGNFRGEGGVDFRSGKKPEKLLAIILRHFSDPGDLVLDCFAGSGTTGAVAHKMGRRWIMVEHGEHCHTHIIPRLKKVIDGADKSGITKCVNWQRGGGFHYYHVGFLQNH